MRRFLPGLLIVSTALFAGCGKHATEPAPPAGGTGLAPALLITQPPARTASVLYDTDIWAQFDRGLDGRTVTTQTVFFKLNGQRIASLISYDGITRRVIVAPNSILQLQSTYTVEFSTAVHGLDGTPLPSGVFFQFTTNSLRRIVYDFPADDALEGPVVTLGWGGPGNPNPNVAYELYAGADSEAVSQRALPFLRRSTFTRYLPAATWPVGTRVYWALTSENLTTHERLDGPTHAFFTFDPAQVPLDSLIVRPRDYGSNDSRSRTIQYCSSTSFPAGPTCNPAIHWDYLSLGPRVRIASATLRLVAQDEYAGTFAATQPTLWLSQNEWVPCVVAGGGPPFADLTGKLSDGDVVSPLEVDFNDPRFAAMLEAQYRSRGLILGMLLRAVQPVVFHSPAVTDPAQVVRLTVRYYRLPAPATP